MPNNKYIQVLWVENDPKVTEAYPREAEMLEGLQLHSVSTWEEAKEELEADYNKWQAIILDAKCQYAREDADLATRFLSNVFPELEKLASHKDHPIPWYVLSGQGEEDIRELIPKTRLDWDSEWDRTSNRPFYSKNGKLAWGSEEKHERQILFQRIRVQVSYYNHEYQLRNALYPNVFEALDSLNLHEAEGCLIDLLEPIHFKGTDVKDYNRRYIDLRKMLEYIFRDMVEREILPPFLVSDAKGKDEVNLSWSSLFLGADMPETTSNLSKSDQKLWGKVTRTSAPLLPKQLSGFLKMAVFQTGGAVHTSRAEAEIQMNLEKYLSQVNMSPNMLRSLALAMCDFILWYNQYTIDHPDPKKNASLWTLTDQKY
ncbi:MAG: hypothetical protein EGQ20_12055 [Bacteroides oleiciplenus]|nr:hypothetical protein [Bacteroides oleiciplenus]